MLEERDEINNIHATRYLFPCKVFEKTLVY